MHYIAASIVGLGILLSCSKASALSCNDYAAETMTLQLAKMTRGGEPAAPPPMLHGRLVLSNTAGRGDRGDRGLTVQLTTEEEPYTIGDSFSLVERYRPTASEQCFMDTVSKTKSRGRCTVPNVPIVPGLYAHNGSFLEAPAFEMMGPSLAISPERGRVHLSFTLDEQELVATYRVTKTSLRETYRIACPSNDAAAPGRRPTSGGCAGCAVGSRRPASGWFAVLATVLFLLLGARRRVLAGS